MTPYIKSIIRKTGAGIYYLSNRALAHLRGKAVILMYHRVVTEKERNRYFIQPGMYVKTAVFEKQMRFLKEHFQILSFSELLDLWKEKSWDESKKYCVITFDDGWLDNYLYAYPILKRYGIPATIFLPTSLVGTNEWFWPEKLGYLLQHYYSGEAPQEQKAAMSQFLKDHSWGNNNGSNLADKIDSLIERCKDLPTEDINGFLEKLSETCCWSLPEERLLLNWEEIQEMSQHGISFGSHSATHRILTGLPVKEIQKEVEGSLDVLRKNKTNHIPVFCYPNGAYTSEVVRQVKLAGYQAAVSTRSGFEDSLTQDIFTLKRIGIHNDISATLPLFSFHLSGMNLKMAKKKENNPASTFTSDVKVKTILHIFSGDLWAGAEVMIFNLLNKLKDQPDMKMIALSLNEGILADKLRHAGIETHIIPEGKNSLAKVFARAFKLLRKRNIDIIHAHRYKENLLALLLTKSLGVKRLVSTLHGLSEPPCHTQNGGNSIGLKTRINYFVLNRFFTRVVVVSHDIKNVLIEKNGFHAGKVDVVHNGIDLPRSPISRVPDSSSRFFHIGTVGRMVPVKDFNLFLEVAAEIKKHTDAVRFSILGDGPLKKQLIKRAHELKIGDCVQFLTPRQDPLSYYQSLDLYLNTSLHEGIPLSILEAMACGKPAVAPRVGGMPEIISNGEYGLLVEGREPERFVSSCMMLMNNRKLSLRMGESASKRIETYFSSFKMAESYRQVYQHSCKKFSS